MYCCQYTILTAITWPGLLFLTLLGLNLIFFVHCSFVVFTLFFHLFFWFLGTQCRTTDNFGCGSYPTYLSLYFRPSDTDSRQCKMFCTIFQAITLSVQLNLESHQILKVPPWPRPWLNDVNLRKWAKSSWKHWWKQKSCRNLFLCSTN